MVLISRWEPVIEIDDEVTRCDAYRAGKANDDSQRRVPQATLDLGHVHQTHGRSLGDVRLCQPLATSELAKPRAEHATDARIPLVRHVRIVRTRPLDPLRPSTRGVATSTSQEDA
jgi:hypothetical protein